MMMGLPEGTAGNVLLAPDVYWRNGVSTAPPFVGQGWTAGLSGLASSASITILRVLASPLNVSSNQIRVSYNADATPTQGKYWNGASYTNHADATAWSNHVLYSGEIHNGVISGGAASVAWLYQITETDTSQGFPQVDVYTVA